MNSEEIHLSKISADLILEEKGMTREWVQKATAHIPRSEPIKTRKPFVRKQFTYIRNDGVATAESEKLRDALKVAVKNGALMFKIGREAGISKGTVQAFAKSKILNPFNTTASKIWAWLENNKQFTKTHK